VLHSFYNGVENIFTIVAKHVDQFVPEGPRSHRDLLSQTARATAARPALISKNLYVRLGDYLGFRHFYRHTYAFFIEWSEMENLVTGLVDVWTDLKAELRVFVEDIS
jgi:hypothetical protein